MLIIQLSREFWKLLRVSLGIVEVRTHPKTNAIPTNKRRPTYEMVRNVYLAKLHRNNCLFTILDTTM